MREIGAEELKDILEAHKKWIYDLVGGRQADLSGADLSEADLSKANLSEANLFKTNLSEADLSGANLSEANLSEANLASIKADEKYLSIIGTKGKIIVFGTRVWIGCIENTIQGWLEKGEAIAEENDYSKKEIEMYRKYILYISEYIKT